MKKYLGYILIPFLAVFLMSHNVMAVDLSNSVSFVQGLNMPYWQTSNGESSHTGSYALGNNFDYTSSNYVRIYNTTGGSFTVSPNHFVSITGLVTAYSATGGNASNNAMSQAAGVFGLGATISSGQDCHAVDLSYDSQVSYTSSGYQYRYSFEYICKVTNSGATNPVTNLWYRSNNTGLGGTTRVDMSLQRITVWESAEGFDDSDIITAINRVNSALNNLNSNIIDTNDKLDEILSNQDTVSDFINEQQDSIDNINNQSPSDIGSSDNTGTTNLINSLGGFITTIANAPATNCIINGDLGHVDLGGINLCQGKEHFNTLVEFIGFSALFGVVFWAGYHLVKRTLSLIDWARSK